MHGLNLDINMSNVASKTTKDYVGYRSFLMANVDTILQAASTLRQAASIESEDLFGFDDETDQVNGAVKEEIRWQEKNTDLPIFQVLLKEKDSLGLFVSGNPLDQYSDLQEWARETAARDDIYLILITKIRKIFTKAGQMMLALQVTLDTGEVEGVIFPKKAMDLSPRLAEAELFWVRGKISKPKKREAKVEAPAIVPSLQEEIDEDDEEQSDMENNVENTTAETTEETKYEFREEVKEYDELPKLLIDNLVAFEDGILSLLSDEDFKISVNREKMFKQINWAKLKTNPENLELEVSGDQNSIQNDSKNGDNGNQETENQNAGKKVIKVTKKMGPEMLTQIKQALKKEATSETVEIELWVETQAELKKVKGQFWLPVALANKF